MGNPQLLRNTFYSFPDGEGEPEAVDVSGMLESAQTYTYDADGRILSQTERGRPTGTSTRNDVSGHPVTFPSWILGVSNRDGTGSGLDQYNDLTVLNVSSVVSYTGTNLGYDAAGRLKGYSYNVTGGSTQTFLSSYLGRDSWLEAAVDASSTNTNERPTSSTIAYDAAGREISIRERTVYATIDDRWRFFANDGEGHILRRRDGTEPQAGGAFTQGTTTLDQQTSNHHMVYANGQQVAALDEAGTIDALSHVTGFANTNIGSTNVVVQDGETLQSIAQRIYGNSSLWYVLAAANALDANTALVAGTTLKAPEVTTNKNDASTFKPYNPSDITGPTSPGLPYIHAPPAASACGMVAAIIVLIVVIIVTIYTAGATSEMLAPASSTVAAGATVAGAAGAAGAGFGVTMAAGVAALSGASGLAVGLAAGFVGGMVGNIAGQVVGDMLGVHQGFSLKEALVGGLTTAASAGIGAEISGGQGFAQLLAKGAYGKIAAGAAANALSSYAANRLVGNDVSFSWKSIAASVVASVVSAKIGNSLGLTTDNFADTFANGLIGGTVSAVANQAIAGGPNPNWKGIVADAFGNAVANGLVNASLGGSFWGPPSSGDPNHPNPSEREKAINAARSLASIAGVQNNDYLLASGYGGPRPMGPPGVMSTDSNGTDPSIVSGSQATNLDRIEVVGQRLPQTPSHNWLDSLWNLYEEAKTTVTDFQNAEEVRLIAQANASVKYIQHTLGVAFRSPNPVLSVLTTVGTDAATMLMGPTPPPTPDLIGKAVSVLGGAMQSAELDIKSAALDVKSYLGGLRAANPVMQIGDIITEGESRYSGNYEAYNTGSGGVKAPRHPSEGTITDKTIDQLIAAASLPITDPNRRFAVGKYQTIPNTLSAAVTAMRLTGTELYDPYIQDAVFADYLFFKAGGGSVANPGPLANYYYNGVGTVDTAMYAAAKEWGSLAVPEGYNVSIKAGGGPSNGSMSYYPNQAVSLQATAQLRAILENQWKH